MTARDMTLCENNSLPGLLKYWAETNPERLAFREKNFGIWERTNFKEYFERSKHFAYGLKELGFGEDDFLAVAGEDTPEWMYADMAAQGLGGACIGVYPTNPWPEVKYILNHSKARFVVCGDQEQVDKILDAMDDADGLPHLEKIICVDMKGMRKYAQDTILSFDDVLTSGRVKQSSYGDSFEKSIESLSPDHTAIVVYTSGTTGQPKGAMLSHEGLIWGALKLAKSQGINDKNWNVVCYLPLCHVAERLFSTVMQLTNGTDVNFAESVDAVTLNLREIAPKGFLGVPRIWEKLQQSVMVRLSDASKFQRTAVEFCLKIGKPIAQRQLENGGRRTSIIDRLTFFILWVVCFRALQKHVGLNNIQNCFCGGASVSPEVLLFFWTIGIPVMQIYGMTELSGISHSQRIGSTTLGTSGPVLESYEQKLAPDGEILVRSRAVFKGYLHNEEATKNTVIDGWLHTGDIGEILEDGSISITDRKKDIIITSGGKNITPSLIENRLKDSIYVREAILLGDGRNFLSALIQLDFETVGKWAQGEKIAYTNYKSLAENNTINALISDVVQSVNEEFARVENVRKFVILKKELDHDDGEVTATMKVRRAVIETKFKPEITEIYGAA
ncbi:MAG: AMP-binding protein [Pseudomonas marincola]